MAPHPEWPHTMIESTSSSVIADARFAAMLCCHLVGLRSHIEDPRT